MHSDIPQEIHLALESVSQIVPRLLCTPLENGYSVEFISPFVLHVIYKAAAVHFELQRTDLSCSHGEEYNSLKNALEQLNSRWKSAGEY